MLQKVVRSTVIDAPIERVWAVLRDFNSHDQWHDVVAESRIEGGERSDQVGCVRSFSLKDGNRIREQLLTLDDRQYKSTYCIVEATVPLQRYAATVTLKPVTDGNRTFWHWESTFATPPGRERELRDMVAQGVYEAGFANLRRHLQRANDLRAPGQAAMPVAIALPTRCVRLQGYGDAAQLRTEDVEVPPPAPGEVRIRQRAIGLNFIDVYQRRGLIPAMLAPGGTPGMEAAGSVLDCGEGVHGFLADERVAYLCPQPGAYTGVRNVPAQWLVRLPPAVDDEVAAALLLKGLTADALLHDVAPVRPGARWLVHAAAGALGQVLCQWASRLGAQVIGTVSTEGKARVARAHGCAQVVVTPDYRFADAVQALGGADVIVDGLGRQAQQENLAALAPCGHWISLGQASGPVAPLDPDALLMKSATFSRPIVFAYVAQPQVLARRAACVWAALADGSIGVPTIERFTLASAAQAHERLESRERSGALILIP
ncbi:SRPBCC family protein [Pseudorhodoferax sp.]|uniref:SRPBCC family protein n=1 Tax=Pseudorhodoferax sp. TaxID=1993553 RepID=UPI002DD644DB|nr:SRPBCC family protein [Pseudorhodoferax sp.]